MFSESPRKRCQARAQRPHPRPLRLEQLEDRRMLHWGYANFDLVREHYTTPYTVSFDVREDLTGNRYSDDDPVIPDVFARIVNVVTTDETGKSAELPDVKLGAGESIQLDVGCTAEKYNRYDAVPVGEHLHVKVGEEADGTPIHITSVDEYKRRFAPDRPILFAHEYETIVFVMDEFGNLKPEPGTAFYFDEFGTPEDFQGLSENHAISFSRELQGNRCRLTYTLEYESNNPLWDAPHGHRIKVME